jgi:hypothetical protein
MNCAREGNHRLHLIEEAVIHHTIYEEFAFHYIKEFSLHIMTSPAVSASLHLHVALITSQGNDRLRTSNFKITLD